MAWHDAANLRNLDAPVPQGDRVKNCFPHPHPCNLPTVPSTIVGVAVADGRPTHPRVIAPVPLTGFTSSAQPALVARLRYMTTDSLSINAEVVAKSSTAFARNAKCQRLAIFRRSPRQAGPHLNEHLDPRHAKHNRQPLGWRGQRADLFPQHREKKALNMVPGVGLRLAQRHLCTLIRSVICR